MFKVSQKRRQRLPMRHNSVSSMQSSMVAAVLLMIVALPISAADAGPDPLPPELEMQLALSALPEHLRAGATVYTLDPSTGFKVARKGSNGFHTFVARNDPGIYQSNWDHRRYDDLIIPVAFDEAGVESHIRPYFDLAKFRAEGKSALEAQRQLRANYESSYQAPSRAGIAFMLSPMMRAYRGAHRTSEIATFSSPHYMFYAPEVAPEQVGSSPSLNHPVMLSPEPGPHGLIVVLKGRAEQEEIRAEYGALLEALCNHDQDLCLP